MPRKKTKSLVPADPQKSSAAQFLTYVASTGAGGEKYEIRYEDENIWMSQKMLAAVYGVDLRTVSYHVNKVFRDAELDKGTCVQKFWIHLPDGRNYEVAHYNLQVIIALGFKVNNERAVQFRKWANQIVSEYTEALFPDEHLELFRGRVVIAGPNEAYRIHFNWEGCGKQSGWTADFTDPEAPIVPLGRISIRMLKKHVVEFKRFPPGVFDPRIMERIPDPADRYASLALWNHKLTKRIPREILDDYKTQPPPGPLAKGSESSG